MYGGTKMEKMRDNVKFKSWALMLLLSSLNSNVINRVDGAFNAPSFTSRKGLMKPVTPSSSIFSNTLTSSNKQRPLYSVAPSKASSSAKKKKKTTSSVKKDSPIVATVEKEPSTYGAGQITVLEGLEPVRKRPGMCV